MLHIIDKQPPRTGARRWAATLVSIAAVAAAVAYSGETVYPTRVNEQTAAPSSTAPATPALPGTMDYYPALFPEPQGQPEAPIPTF
jgi:hypothetical protein